MKKMLVVALIIVFIQGFVGCGISEREYYDDIIITLQDSSEKIIIKEWHYLLGSGAEIYYQKEDDNPTLLGKTTGGDDGFCPFMEGAYEIVQDGRTVTVKWSFRPSDKDKTIWKSEIFDLADVRKYMK